MQQPDRAVPLFEADVAELERMFGSDHAHVWTEREDLAYALRKSGRADRAIPLFEAIRDDWVQRRGAADPDALRARNNLAAAYAAAGRLDDAVALYASTLADCEQVLGRNHLTTRTVRESLQRMR
jgi:tetratricopeptide (TPR) repeat protein